MVEIFCIQIKFFCKDSLKSYYKNEKNFKSNFMVNGSWFMVHGFTCYQLFLFIINVTDSMLQLQGRSRAQHEQRAHRPLDFIARPSAYYAALSLTPAVL